MTPPSNETHRALPQPDELSKYRELVETLPGWKRIGDLLVELGYLTSDQLMDGLKAQRRAIITRQRTVGLLDALLDAQMITPDQAHDALNYQIAHCYLPALAQALGSRDQAMTELRETYQRSLQTIASYAETASLAKAEGAILTERVATLERELARYRRAEPRQ